MRTNMKMVIGLLAVLMIASSFAVTISSGDSAAETGDGNVFAADVRDLCDSVFGEGKIGISVESDVVTIHVNPSDITTVAADDDVKNAIKAFVHDYKYIYVNGDSIVNNSKPDMAQLLPLQISSAETFKSCELALGDNEIITYDVKTVKTGPADESITESFILRMVVEFTDPALLVGVQAVQSNLIVSADPVVMGFDLSGTNLQDIVPLEAYGSMDVLDYLMVLFSDYENLDLGNMQPVLDYSMGILKNSHIDPVAAAEAAIKNFAHRATTVIDNGSEKYYFAVNDDGSIVTDVPEGYVCGWTAPVSVFTEGQIIAPAVTLYAGNAIIEANAEVILPTDSSVTVLGATVSEAELMIGESATVSVDVDNPGSVPYSVVFTSSDETIVTVDPLTGDVLAVGPGVATIGATVPGNNTVFVDVTVTVSVEGITLDVDYVQMDVGDSYVLVATVIPAQASDKNLLWVSENTDVALVNESGVVTAVGGGSTVITVITEDGGFTASCIVEVIVHVTGITLDKEYVQLSIGETVTLVPIVLPDEATDKSVMWESDDTSVVIVDDFGNITAVSAGLTYIYATTVDGSYFTYCEVEVDSLYHYEVRYQDIDGMMIANVVSGSAAYGETVVGELIDIPGYVTPAESKSIVISDDVSKNIIVYTYSYVPTPVSGVELNKTEMKLDVGKKSTLVATVLPTYAVNKNIFWSSSDESVVTVDQFGSVVAVAEGVATITVTTVDGGFTATCEVTVPVHVKGVSLDMTSASVAVGSEFTLVATVTPDNATNKAVSWSSSNKSVATVDENGNVVVKAPGKATITVITKDKSFIATCKIVAIADQTYVVNYTDEHGEIIAEPFIGIAHYGETVTGPLATVTGYTAPAEQTIVISEKSYMNVINYVYTVTSYGYTVNYVDGNGTVLAEPFTGTASYGATVTGPLAVVPGYTAPVEQTLVISDDVSKNVIDYVYTVNEYSYVVDYLDEAGNAIAESFTGTASYGETVTGPLATVTGYTAPAEQTLVISDDELVNYIKYTYLTNEYQYTVNYVDTDGNVIADAYVGTAPYAALVVPEVPEIVGYTAPAEQTIVISDDESENVVDYVYTVNKYGYTINYLNKDEAKIAKSLTGTAAFGTTVVGKVLDIAGYITPEPISIVIDADESVNVIDYVYLPAPAPVAVTGVTLDKTSVYFGIGETVTLVATVAPADAANKNVIWSSSSKAVVTVADGVLTAVSVGKATVTVTTVDGGFTATCEVTVTDVPVVHVNGIYLSKSTVTLDKGTTTVLSAMVLPDNATDKTVVWSSSKDSVATVVDGVVTAVAKGTATITVTTVDGGFTATCAVTVNDDTEEGPMWGVVVIFAVVCAGIIGYLVVLARRAKE